MLSLRHGAKLHNVARIPTRDKGQHRFQKQDAGSLERNRTLTSIEASYLAHG